MELESASLRCAAGGHARPERLRGAHEPWPARLADARACAIVIVYRAAHTETRIYVHYYYTVSIAFRSTTDSPPPRNSCDAKPQCSFRFCISRPGAVIATMPADYYSTLGVARDASDEQIKKACVGVACGGLRQRLARCAGVARARAAPGIAHC